MSKERLIITASINIIKNNNRKYRKQKWEEKELYRCFKWKTKENAYEKTYTWLRKEKLNFFKIPVVSGSFHRNSSNSKSPQFSRTILWSARLLRIVLENWGDLLLLEFLWRLPLTTGIKKKLVKKLTMMMTTIINWCKSVFTQPLRHGQDVIHGQVF